MFPDDGCRNNKMHAVILKSAYGIYFFCSYIIYTYTVDGQRSDGKCFCCSASGSDARIVNLTGNSARIVKSAEKSVRIVQSGRSSARTVNSGGRNVRIDDSASFRGLSYWMVLRLAIGRIKFFSVFLKGTLVQFCNFSAIKTVILLLKAWRTKTNSKKYPL